MPWREAEYPEILNVVNLRMTSAWIRDELDSLMAREGPNELHPDDVLTLHNVFLSLQHHKISLATMQFSRIHLAIADVCGKATRWPRKLVDEADRVVASLEKCYGPLKAIRTPLYEVGGRLHGISEPRDLTRDALLRRFSEDDPTFTDNTRAYFNSSLGFKPGQWWINGLFAFRDGIIDDKCTDGGICYNELGAYAIVLQDSDEENSPSPDSFTYKCRSDDKGRFRLTAADFRSRYPVRVLRSNTLSSLWTPRAGIRYDGLHRVAGWTIRHVKPDENDGFEVMFDIHFERDDETPFNHVMRHPLADEVDDYKAYKYCSREQRNAEKHGALRLGSLNYRTTSQMNLSEKDFQEQFRRPSDVGKDHLHFEEPRAGRTPSLHRMEIVAADHQFQKRTLDGSAEETDEDFIHALGFGPRHAQNEPMPPQKHRGLTHLEPFSALHALHSHRRGESYDGITDETVLAHPRTQLQSDIPPSVEQVHNHPSMVTTHFESINWNPAPHFYEVDWNPPPRTPPRRQSRVSNAFSHVNLQCLDKTSEPTSPTSPDDCAK